jgi:hypothetical protein
MTENKHPEDMTPEERREIKIEFAPGCFDSFDGTQEELDELMADIRRMIDSGELFERAQPVDVDAMSDDEALALAKALGIDIETGEEIDRTRNLQ